MTFNLFICVLLYRYDGTSYSVNNDEKRGARYGGGDRSGRHLLEEDAYKGEQQLQYGEEGNNTVDYSADWDGNNTVEGSAPTYDNQSRKDSRGGTVDLSYYDQSRGGSRGGMVDLSYYDQSR